MVKCFTLKGGKSAGKVVCQGSKGAKKNYDDNKVKTSSRKGTQPKKPRELKTARARLTTTELKGLLRRNGYTGRQLEGKTKRELLRLPPTRRLKNIKDKERTRKAMGVVRSRFKKQGTSDRTNEKQGEEIMELKKKVAKKPRRKRRTKKEVAEARAMGREDKRSGGGGKKASFKPGTYDEEEKRNNYKNFLKDYYEAEDEGYRDEKYQERRAYYDNEKRGEDRLVKLMEQSSGHAFRFTRKIFNRVKKKKFNTRKEFEEAFSKEIGYTL